MYFPSTNAARSLVHNQIKPCKRQLSGKFENTWIGEIEDRLCRVSTISSPCSLDTSSVAAVLRIEEWRLVFRWMVWCWRTRLKLREVCGTMKDVGTLAKVHNSECSLQARRCTTESSFFHRYQSGEAPYHLILAPNHD
jgi:hypothetical protein